ncbi:dihydrolipoyl dehydrogenase [Leptospira kobayashii]|uniref:Dihydrolipoyl dehydrogenase n=1 Tax=Leptospira kobayashii TaxID=1917830 RepID=A0ABN6KIR3_9LEPT|nr:dihydrolipoyl dehydrogenase [Leptospira kobayashii]BDA79056.1 dihydrolipoyl dehydrogenase [Leptospira kobayashii]
MKEYDIIVIGTGGGTKLVTPPSKLGLKVAAFEKESPGGTCLNRGCIPSKMLIYPTEIIRFSEDSSKFPLHFDSKPRADFSTIVKRVSETVDADSRSIPIAYEKNPNIDYYPYYARFVSDKVIEANGETFTAKHIFVTVGTRPNIPDIQGLEGTPYWTSREALRSESLPKSLAVIGAGYIALELGSAYKAYGTEVEGFARAEILSSVDSEIREEFKKHPPYPINDHFQMQKISFEKGLFTLTGKDKYGNSYSRSFEKLLIATGVRPNTDDLGIESTSIELDSRGYIKVNEYLETGSTDVYAFGDVIGRYFFRHTANFEGEHLFQTLIADKKKTKIEYPPVPGAVFTHPQIATVGLTEEELISKKIPYWKGVNRYSSSAMGMARMSEVGFVKVLVDKETETILGAHIIGDEASDMIHQLILAMSLKANLDQMLRMIYIHPALPEVVRNAFRKVKEERIKEKGY